MVFQLWRSEVSESLLEPDWDSGWPLSSVQHIFFSLFFFRLHEKGPWLVASAPGAAVWISPSSPMMCCIHVITMTSSRASVATGHPGAGKVKTWRESGLVFYAKRNGAVPTQAALLLGLHAVGPLNGSQKNWSLSGSYRLRGL